MPFRTRRNDKRVFYTDRSHFTHRRPGEHALDDYKFGGGLGVSDVVEEGLPEPVCIHGVHPDVCPICREELENRAALEDPFPGNEDYTDESDKHINPFFSKAGQDRRVQEMKELEDPRLVDKWGSIAQKGHSWTGYTDEEPHDEPQWPPWEPKREYEFERPDEGELNLKQKWGAIAEKGFIWTSSKYRDERPDKISEFLNKPNWRQSNALNRYLHSEAKAECECGDVSRGINGHGYHAIGKGMEGHKLMTVDGRKHSIDAQTHEHIEGAY